MLDWRGVPVQAGDSVIYASRSGSSLNIIEGDVVKIHGEIAEVEFIRDRYSKYGPRKQNTFRVSGKYLTVVGGLPPADDSA